MAQISMERAKVFLSKMRLWMMVGWKRDKEMRLFASVKGLLDVEELLLD